MKRERDYKLDTSCLNYHMNVIGGNNDDIL